MCSGLLIEPWLISSGAARPSLHPTHNPNRRHTCGGDGAEMVEAAWVWWLAVREAARVPQRLWVFWFAMLGCKIFVVNVEAWLQVIL